MRMTASGGEWNFSFQSAIWTIAAGGVTAGSAASRTSEINQVLDDLNGQTPDAVKWTPNETLLATFVEGARMEASCDRSDPKMLM